MLDQGRFPELYGYLQKLPAGIDSYPECTARASLLRGVLAEWNGTVPTDGLPAQLASLMRAPPPADAWVPEVAYVAAHYAINDLEELGTERMLELTYRASRRLTESRMYRVLTKVGSPTIIVRGASISWGRLHRGVPLRMGVTKGRARLLLRHPKHLWPALAHESAALGFRAVLESAGASEISMQIIASHMEGVELELAWRE